MNGETSYKKQAIKYILPALILSLFFAMLGKMAPNKKTKMKTGADTSAIMYPYRTIDSPGNSKSLFSYILHKQKSQLGSYMEGPYIEYSAVIRSIDPSKDDYKTYCQCVINDIIKTTGTDELSITIYDDDNAYELDEMQSSQQYKILNKQETDIVGKHTVATYYGNNSRDDADNYQLTFYEDENNGYYSKEQYLPTAPKGKNN